MRKKFHKEIKKLGYKLIYVCLSFWYKRCFGKYFEALVQQGIYNYRNSWKFKERWRYLGLKEAENFTKYYWDIHFHMKQLPFAIKWRIFKDSMILRIPPHKISFYVLD